MFYELGILKKRRFFELIDQPLINIETESAFSLKGTM